MKALGKFGSVVLSLMFALIRNVPAQGQDQVLHSFQGRPGQWPYAGLVSDAAGNLYGTTRYGGCEDACGAVFELERESDGSWKYKVLHAFKGIPDGSEPDGSLIFDASGNLYGTTVSGGALPDSCYHGCGTVFELSPSAKGGWDEEVLYRFQSGTDGWAPESALIFGTNGNLYGTTVLGGSPQGCGGITCGTVFELSPKSGGGWTENILYRFAGAPDGAEPWGPLTWDNHGNLYGTTENGGTANSGTVFELSPSSGGTWSEQPLYGFAGGSGGSTPIARVLFDDLGNLYGTTLGGGNSSNCSTGCGTVFELAPVSGGKWKQATLYTFAGGSDGANPYSALVFDSSGDLYGTTFYGGTNGIEGTVFKLTPAQGQWSESIAYTFSGGSDGAHPAGDLIWDTAGHLLSTTEYGGSGDKGVVFELKP